MATTTQIFEEDVEEVNSEFRRQEIQAAIAKAVELRAIHAALVQGNSPGNLRFSSASPVSHHLLPQLSAQDYPVFTPSYEDEPLPGYKQLQLENQNYAEVWDYYNLGTGSGSESVLMDYRKTNASLRKAVANATTYGGNIESPHVCPVAEDQKSVTGSCTDQITVLRASPGAEFSKSRRNSLGDLRSLSSCNKCKPAVISTESDANSKIGKSSNLVVPLSDLHSSVQSHPRTKGLNFSWLFPRLKRKNKNESSPIRTESEDVCHMYKDIGGVSIEMLKKELVEANESRDAALIEAAEMKSSIGELRQKLEYLESYCEELKKSLRLAKDSQVPVKLKSLPGGEKNSMPVSEDVMLEGFLQIVSEARLSVKQFCKTLIKQIEETDTSLTENLNILLLPYKLTLNSKYSKAVLYHLEAIINQTLYQDFENCVFQKNGSPKYLDPEQDRQAQFSSFVALRNLSWNEVLRKGTKYYSEEFSKFCDHKMSCIITSLNWNRPWPEQLLQAFFVSAKCIWLLHLLAFSFCPPLVILRIEENRAFDSHFMEDIFADRQRSQGLSQVKVMVMPGFYVHERVLRCKVICRYKSAA